MHTQEVVLIDDATDGCDQLAAYLLPMAQAELLAFAHAVRELVGPEQARQSVEDWMEELDLMDWPAEGATPDWRCLTIRAAARLAERANIPALRNDPASTLRGL